LRSSLNKAAFVLALATSRHPGSVNRELNDVMGVERRDEASKEQLREALAYAGDRLRALRWSRGERRRPTREEADFASGGEPPF
jgi:ribonuclease HI